MNQPSFQLGTAADGVPFVLPLEAVTQKFAFFAQSGAGKSYAAMKLAEEMLALGAQVLILDPVGIWWGLRVAADGARPGFPIVVFGGDYGDLPLPPDAGALVADLLIEQQIAAVLDVSGFELPEQRRFTAAFAERFFQRKKQARSPVHLFLEEAQTFAPLRPERDETVMLNRIERLARLGRNYGVGWSIISQRPQEVHTKVRNQAGTLIALRTIGPHERRAVAEWMDDKATTSTDLDLIGELPALATGIAHIYSPAFLKVSVRVRIAPRQTFDSSATPAYGTETLVPRALSPLDITALRERFTAALEQPPADTPAAYRERILDLERQLRTRPTHVERVMVPVLRDDQIAQITALVQAIGDASGQLTTVAQDIAAVLTRVADGQPQPVAGERLPEPDTPPAHSRRRHQRSLLGAADQTPEMAPTDPPTNTPADADEERGAVQLRAGERRMLETLGRRYPLKLTRAQLGTLAKFVASGGTFTTYLGTLKRAGLAAEIAGEIQITAAGLNYLGQEQAPPPQTTAEVLELWHSALRAGERSMLDVLIAVYPEARSRDWLAEQTGYALRGGTFGTYLGTLRRNGLIEEVQRGGDVRASPTLFLNGRA